jgi:hypothetical protein
LHTSRLGKLVISLPLVSVGGHACLHPAPCTKVTTTAAAIAIIVIIITTYARTANMLHTRWAGGRELLFRLAHVKCCSSVPSIRSLFSGVGKSALTMQFMYSEVGRGGGPCAILSHPSSLDYRS